MPNVKYKPGDHGHIMKRENLTLTGVSREGFMKEGPF